MTVFIKAVGAVFILVVLFFGPIEAHSLLINIEPTSKAGIEVFDYRSDSGGIVSDPYNAYQEQTKSHSHSGFMSGSCSATSAAGVNAQFVRSYNTLGIDAYGAVSGEAAPSSYVIGRTQYHDAASHARSYLHVSFSINEWAGYSWRVNTGTGAGTTATYRLTNVGNGTSTGDQDQLFSGTLPTGQYYLEIDTYANVVPGYSGMGPFSQWEERTGSSQWDTSFRLFEIAQPVPPTVPVPATLPLLGSALAGLGLLGRWKSRKIS